MRREWIAAYYPADVFDDQRLKTVLCLLYDKVVIHFPVSGMACGGGHGISEAFSDDPLVEEGILDLKEEVLIEDIEGDFTPGHPLGSYEELRRYYELNVTGMALRYCQDECAVPVTDQADTPIPISVLGTLDLEYAARMQASALAIESVSLVLPPFAALNSHEILEAREALKDELGAFRDGMLGLAPEVRSGIGVNAPVAKIYKEAKYIAETNVLPRVAELRRRLALERGTFWRKLVHRISGHCSSIALKWISGAALSAAIDGVRIGGDIVAQGIDYDALVGTLVSNGGLGYLVSLDERFKSRGIQERIENDEE